jgi:hypothetical protein
MRMVRPQPRHLTALAVLVAVVLTVVMAASVAWTTASDSSSPPSRSEAPALTPTEAHTARAGLVTGDRENPWALNDPAVVLRFLAEYCPGAPQLTSEMVHEMVEALQTCLAERSALPDTAAR